MAWYDDRAKTQFVGTYANEKQLQWDAEAAKKRGWTIQSTDDGSDQVIGLDPEVAKAARGKAKITVTFIREQDWLVNREREISSAVQNEAARTADGKEARLVKADSDLQRAEETFASRADAVAAPAEAQREQVERELLGAVKDVLTRRRTALKAIDEAIEAMKAAVAVGASEFARSAANHQQTREAWLVRLKAEEQLLERQESVARLAKDWKTAWDRKRMAEEELRKRSADFDSRDTTLDAGTLPRDEALKTVRLLDS
ncbi:MAG: hypothetical protein ABI577_11245 [bacterium]